MSNIPVCPEDKEITPFLTFRRHANILIIQLSKRGPSEYRNCLKQNVEQVRLPHLMWLDLEILIAHKLNRSRWTTSHS
jgi:hypothetical protein